jgi:hypothetical protein
MNQLVLRNRTLNLRNRTFNLFALLFLVLLIIKGRPLYHTTRPIQEFELPFHFLLLLLQYLPLKLTPKILLIVRIHRNRKIIIQTLVSIIPPHLTIIVVKIPHIDQIFDILDEQDLVMTRPMDSLDFGGCWEWTLTERERMMVVMNRRRRSRSRSSRGEDWRR